MEPALTTTYAKPPEAALEPPAGVEQSVFTGQEYDVDTGLSYMNARYYDGTIGRFLSQDPLAIEALQTSDPNSFIKIISNPQYWNTYSYALNNPLVATDPSGLLTIIIPGTWHDEQGWKNEPINTWAQQAFGEKPVVFSKEMGWSNDDNTTARDQATKSLENYINDYKFSEGEQLNVIGHSHGGTIALNATFGINKKIDNLVTLGTPSMLTSQVNRANVGNWINVYSNFDYVQINAGTNTTFTESLWNRVLGYGGSIIGKALGAGEHGWADRTFGRLGAQDKDASIDTVGFDAHGQLHTKQIIWDKYVRSYLQLKK